MKVLIDIPDKEYNRIKGKTEVNYSEMWIAEGTPLDGLTNGEVMQKMFPYLKPTYIDEWKDYNNTHSLFAKAWVNVDFGDGKTLGFELLWWNRKWGE